MKKYSRIMEHMSVGKQKASFTPHMKGLAKINVITLILAIPTLGIARFWYGAALRNAKLQGTSFGNISFSGTYTGVGIFIFFLTNLLLVFATLGLGIPAAIQRVVYFNARHTVIQGNTNGIISGDASSSDAGKTGDAIIDMANDYSGPGIGLM